MKLDLKTRITCLTKDVNVIIIQLFNSRKCWKKKRFLNVIIIYFLWWNTYQYNIFSVGPIYLLPCKFVTGISLLLISAFDCDKNKSFKVNSIKKLNKITGTIFTKSAMVDHLMSNSKKGFAMLQPVDSLLKML